MEDNKKNEQPAQPQVNVKVKYYIIAAAVILAVIAAVLVVFFSGTDEAANTADVSSTETADAVNTPQTAETADAASAPAPADSTADDKTYTPVFMYFVSKSDEGYNEYMNVVDELKAEYDGRVDFKLVDVDEEPEAKKNFEMVDGNTPFLIMTDIKNDIVAFEFKCGDKATLTADIERAF